MDLTASDNSVPPWISGEFDVNALLRGAPLVLSRAQFLDDVERQLQVTRKSIDSRFAVLLVSLDNYNTIVMEKGKTAADLVIRAIVEPVGPMLARHDGVAIIGSGTIAILLETARLRAAPQDFAAEVVGEIKAVALESGVVIPSASVGIAKVTGNYVAAEDILRDAGIALHAAQASGTDQTMLFHRGMDEILDQTPIAI
jgi:diguanylate cyclase (GGDEF)-like protein